MKNKLKLIAGITASFLVILATVMVSHPKSAQAGLPHVSVPSESKAAACITNCEVYSLPSACLGSFDVTDPLHCTTRLSTTHWKGMCFVSPDCTGTANTPVISAVLPAGCCGPLVVGSVYVQCADGTSQFCFLTVPSGAAGAVFIVKGLCPPCGVTYCVLATIPCNGQ